MEGQSRQAEQIKLEDFIQVATQASMRALGVSSGSSLQGGFQGGPRVPPWRIIIGIIWDPTIEGEVGQLGQEE